MQTSKIFRQALDNVISFHGRDVFATCGPMLSQALVAKAALDLLAAQDDDISADKVRALLLVVHAEISAMP